MCCCCCGGCCRASKNWGSVLFCIPLGFFMLCSAIVFLGWGAMDAYIFIGADTFNEMGDLTKAVGCGVAALKALMGLLGLIAVLAKWPGGVRAFRCGFKTLVCAVVLAGIVLLIDRLHAGREPDVAFPSLADQWAQVKDFFAALGRWFTDPEDDEAQAAASGAAYFLFSAGFLLLAYWMECAFKSFQAVLEVGGSGWEFRNRHQIRAKRLGILSAARTEKEEDEYEDIDEYV